MALYFGGNEVNVNLNGNIYHLNSDMIASVIDIVKLLSSDGYILRDSNGLYLIPNSSEILSLKKGVNNYG